MVLNMSKLADKTYDLLRTIFPFYTIVPEYYIYYKGTRLFFDFFIKELNLLIEVQGKQHYFFVKHFHTDKEGFLKSKYRDNLKQEYCQANNILLLYIHSEDELSKDYLLNRLMHLLKEVG